MIGEPDAGNPHVRFDEGRQETCVRAARLSPTLQSPQLETSHFGSECVPIPQRVPCGGSMRRSRLNFMLLLLSALFGQSPDQPVSHHDLVSRYENYNGKQVVISGEVLSGPEMTLMF